MSIVTLPCDFGGRRAVSFDVWGVYSDRVFLADLCAKWNGYVSVTDAGEEVCRHCYAQFGNMRVINYGGFGWQWMELVHDNGAFKGLVSYGESIPFGVIGAWFMNGAGGTG